MNPPVVRSLKTLAMESHPFTGAPSSVSNLAVADLQVGVSPAALTGQDTQDLDLDEFSQKLQGTWVREPTWSGIPLETTSAMYFDVKGKTISGMIFDRSNVDKGPLWHRLKSIKANQSLLSKTPMMTFVSSDVLCIDRYFKISSSLAFDGLDILPDASDPTRSAFDQLSQNGFMRVHLETALRAEARQSALAEFNFPAARLAHWRGSLSSVTIGQSAGATLLLEGQYRSAYIAGGKAINEDFAGLEVAHFVRSGNAFVSALGYAPETSPFTVAEEAAPIIRTASVLAETAKRAQFAAVIQQAQAGGWYSTCGPVDTLDIAGPVVQWQRVVVAA